jgi:hypothetical protein
MQGVRELMGGGEVSEPNNLPNIRLPMEQVHLYWNVEYGIQEKSRNRIPEDFPNLECCFFLASNKISN